MGQLAEARTAHPQEHNYLLLSDVHLGAGLVSHARPWAHGWRSECTEVDASLVTCLEHYDATRPGGKPWRLVIAGDFVDFIGMSLTPADNLPSGVTEEERAHGLGSAADHAVRKLHAAAELHHAVFAALARFITSGNELIIVSGNHDVDFHWKPVQRAFIDLLHEHSPTHVRRSMLRKRTRFCPWFYYVKDLLYVEHGHEFDAMCSYGDPLSPVCPRDPRRIRWTPSDVMLRYVARPTRGLSTTVHEQGTVMSYLKLAASLGLREGLRLAWRFARASVHLCSDTLSVPTETVEDSGRRMRRLCFYARRFKVPEDVVTTMRGMYVQPANSAPRELISRLYLDRMLLLSAAIFTVVLALTVPVGLTGGVSLASLALVLTVLSGRTVVRNENPDNEMRRGAEKIAALFPTRYVVMGHTHHPRMDAIADGTAQYVNLGHWGQDDLPEDLPQDVQAPCTHFVITTGEDGARGQLRRWDIDAGPRPHAAPASEAQPAEAPPPAVVPC